MIALLIFAAVLSSPSPNASGLSFGYGGTSSISPLDGARMGNAGGGGHGTGSMVLTVTATVAGFVSITSDGTVTASLGVEPIVTYDGCDADWADDVVCFTQATEAGYIVETVVL